MNLFRKSEVKSLSNWLEIATRKLAAPAKERIKTEIESHFGESVQAHMEGGLSEPAAQAAALAELGDAKSSVRSFRKRHLTEYEASKIESSIKASRNKTTRLVRYSAFVVCTYDQWPLSQNALTRCQSPGLFIALEFIVLIVLPAICFVLSDSVRNKAYTRLIILMVSMSGISEGLIVKWVFIPAFGSHWFAIPLGTALLIQILMAFRLSWKLGSIGPIHNDVPPLDTPCA